MYIDLLFYEIRFSYKVHSEITNCATKVNITYEVQLSRKKQCNKEMSDLPNFFFRVKCFV